jgi:hypothetical protein
MSTALPNVVCQIDGTWCARQIVGRGAASPSCRSVDDECALSESRWRGTSNDSVVVKIGFPEVVDRSVSRVPRVTRRCQYFVLTFYLSIIRC